MARYIKIHIDAKKRNRYSIKKRRVAQLKQYFGNAMQNQQRYNFKNYCQVTGAARSYYSQFAFSRHCLRKSVSFALVPGVMKSSW